MKKLVTALLACLLLVTLAACGNSAPTAGEPEQQPTNPQEGQSAGQTQQPTADGKQLVVYFSWSGNTEGVATEIQSQTGADMFEIVPQTPYSNDYDTLVDLAQTEQTNNARPAMAGSIENLEDYGVIFLGYPNWWSDMPMILYTFLDTYDLSGKTVVPFCTSGGSGFSDTIQTIQTLEPQATVLEGLHLGSGSAADSQAAVAEWLSQIGLAK